MRYRQICLRLVAEGVEVFRQLEIQRDGVGAQGESGPRVLAVGPQPLRAEQLRSHISRGWHMGYLIPCHSRC